MGACEIYGTGRKHGIEVLGYMHLEMLEFLAWKQSYYHNVLSYIKEFFN